MMRATLIMFYPSFSLTINCHMFHHSANVTMSTCLVHNNIKYQVCLEDLMFNFLDQILKLLSLYCCCQVLLKAHCPLHKLEQLLWTNLLLSACFKNVLFHKMIGKNLEGVTLNENFCEWNETVLSVFGKQKVFRGKSFLLLLFCILGQWKLAHSDDKHLLSCSL